MASLNILQSQSPGSFSNALQRNAPIGRWGKRKAGIEYPFEHGDIINYILDCVSIHPVTTKTKIKSNFICHTCRIQQGVDLTVKQITFKTLTNNTVQERVKKIFTKLTKVKSNTIK